MIQVGLIGCGGWAKQTHVPALKTDTNATLKVLGGIHDRHEGIELARENDIPVYTHDWKKIASDANIDAVVISTPHAMHYEQIKYFLGHDKHVHVDKPPTLKAAQLRELLNIAKERKLTLSVHTQMKYAPGITKLQALLDASFSDIYQINGYIWQQLFDDFAGSWRSKPSLAGGGIMMDSGYHILDTIHYLIRNKRGLDSPNFLFHKGGRASDTVGLITYRIAETIVSVSSIRGMPKRVKGQRIEIFGDGGYLYLTISKVDGEKRTEIIFNNKEGHQENYSFTHKKSYEADPLIMFLDAIRTSNKYILKEIEKNNSVALEVVTVLENAYMQGDDND